MSASSSPADPDNADPVIVVLTADTATLAESRERALAERAAKRQAISSKKRTLAKDRQAFGVTLMKIKNYQGAAVCFSDACNLWRSNPVCHCDLATAYLHLGRFEEAEIAASAALALDPRLVEARYTRAMARKARGLVRGAIVDLETVLKLEENNEAAQTSLRELRAVAASLDEEAAAVTAGKTEGTSTRASEGNTEGEGAKAKEGEGEGTAAGEGTIEGETAAAGEAKAVTENAGDSAAAGGSAGSGANANAPLNANAEPEPEIDYATPAIDADKLEVDSGSDTSDANHTGTGVPCLFYNHQGCARGTGCKFSHAPDEKSVRDGIGKNVCLYFLLGACKFGAKCIYSHEREYLPTTRGWWNDERKIEEVRGRVEAVREGARERRAEAEKRRGERRAAGGGKGKGKSGDARNGNGKGVEEGERERERRAMGALLQKLDPEAAASLDDSARGQGQGQGQGQGRGKAKTGKGKGKGKGRARPTSQSMNYAYMNQGVFMGMGVPIGVGMGMPMGMGMGAGLGVGGGQAWAGGDGEAEMEERMANYGFTEYDVHELLAQGVKPWDEDAAVRAFFSSSLLFFSFSLVLMFLRLSSLLQPESNRADLDSTGRAGGAFVLIPIIQLIPIYLMLDLSHSAGGCGKDCTHPRLTWKMALTGRMAGGVCTELTVIIYGRKFI
ncbi:hypothetical protein B0H11DRAFT_920060 [Mycena galericulata]|nr:hypothetical protein B0H11DRAFT_920060 [Mycena galericulata]